jgi:hypothetical protein
MENRPGSNENTAGVRTRSFTGPRPLDDWQPTSEGERPLGELLSEFADQGRRFMRAEMALARDELKDEVKGAGAGAGYVGAGGLAAHAGFFCLCAALVIGLGHLVGYGWSALVVGVVLAAIAAGLASAGRNKLRNVKAPRTRAQVQEDIAWLRQTTRSVKANRHADA